MCVACGLHRKDLGYDMCRPCFEAQRPSASPSLIPFLAPAGSGSEAVSSGGSDEGTMSSRSLTMLPTRPFLGGSDALKAADAECAICAVEYELGDNLCVLPACVHTFHAACVSQWLANHATCPVCSRNIRKDLKTLRETHGRDVLSA